MFWCVIKLKLQLYIQTMLEWIGLAQRMFTLGTTHEWPQTNFRLATICADNRKYNADAQPVSRSSDSFVCS